MRRGGSSVVSPRPSRRPGLIGVPGSSQRRLRNALYRSPTMETHWTSDEHPRATCRPRPRPTGDRARPTPGTRRVRSRAVRYDDRDRDGPTRTFEGPSGPPRAAAADLTRDRASLFRSLAPSGTGTPRNPDKEFRGHGLPEELCAKPVRKGAVMHGENTCSPTARVVKISTPARAADRTAAVAPETAATPVSRNPVTLGNPLPSVRLLTGFNERVSGRLTRVGPITRTVWFIRTAR